jgi:hypothetical protein
MQFGAFSVHETGSQFICQCVTQREGRPFGLGS